jgi:NADH:ubiquinone oxidoreductase subunit F (NADH-binding)/NAD-dependent dihydropyrimidine dehydrogenase PreA subunit
MSRLVDERCCDRCWHGASRPCPNRIDCLVDGPICHESDACRRAARERAERLRRERLLRPAILVGAGTCGLGAGAGKVLEAVRGWLAEKKVEADVIEVGCVGLCTSEPLLDIQLPGRTRLSYGPVKEDKVGGLLEAVMAGNPPAEGLVGQYRAHAPGGPPRREHQAAQDHGHAEQRDHATLVSAASRQPWPNIPYMDEHPFLAPQTRRVLANCGLLDPSNIDEYIACGGYRALAETLQRHTPGELCDIVEKSGLRGRGGGGFPTGAKWKVALHATNEQKYLICNADEGDPGAFMDRAVIEGDPHRLLEGMALAAYAIGATQAYVYIRAEYPLAIRRLAAAIGQAHAAGFLGGNILDSGFSLTIAMKQGAGAFVCGEETALIASIEGRRGMPRPRPPFPAVRGLFDRPTVINNVETLANVPAIIANGPEWFSAVGTKTSKGTKVFALSGNVRRTGLVEVAMGTTMRQIVFDIGGGVPGGKEYKAVQIGGPSGGCIPAQHLDIEVDYESLKAVGAMMGSGGLVVMDSDTCMVDVAKFFMDFIQRESCGKCIPCREGTRRMLEILERITHGRRSETGMDALQRFQGVMYLARLAEVIKDTSLCGLGQSAPTPVLSTLRWFRSEYEAHIYERRCPAGACRELLEYRIDAGKCNGCAVCASKCPAEAIMGAKKSPHYIISEKCIGCGACKDTCKFGAVAVA